MSTLLIRHYLNSYIALDTVVIEKLQHFQVLCIERVDFLINSFKRKKYRKFSLSFSCNWNFSFIDKLMKLPNKYYSYWVLN